MLTLVGYATWRQVFHVWGGLGSDAVLWGLTAMDVRYGAPPPVAPAYPALVALVQMTGLSLVDAGPWVALVAAAALPAATWLAARAAGATRAAAAIAAAAILLWPDAAEWAQQIQPDSLAALGIVSLAGLLASAVRGQERAAWGAAILSGLLPLVRTHGLALVPVTAVILLWAPGRRLARLGLLLATWWLAPALIGVAPGATPLAVPWAHRSTDALGSLFSHDPADVPYARELHRLERERYLALVEAGRTGARIAWHARHSLARALDGWAALALAAVAIAVRPRRRLMAAAAPMAAALPALLIWSQRRHVIVVLPVAFAVLAAAVGTRRWRLGLLAAMLAWTGAGWPARWLRLPARQRGETIRAHSLARVGRWLDDHAPPGSLLGGYLQDVGLYHPLPHHDPDGSSADWRTFVIGNAPVARAGWKPVYDNGAGVIVSQFRPDLDPRPCADARPALGTPFVVAGTYHAKLVGCTTPATGKIE